MAKLTLSLGSNVGDRQRQLAAARARLATTVGRIVYHSAVAESPAWGREDQPSFLNQVLVLELHPDWGADAGAGLPTGSDVPNLLHRLLDRTQAIEAELGRERDLHWGPRTLDIDLIFLDDLRYEDERISLPHPWWRERPFVRDLLPTTDPHLYCL